MPCCFSLSLSSFQISMIFSIRSSYMYNTRCASTTHVTNTDAHYKTRTRHDRIKYTYIVRVNKRILSEVCSAGQHNMRVFLHSKNPLSGLRADFRTQLKPSELPPRTRRNMHFWNTLMLSGRHRRPGRWMDFQPIIYPATCTHHICGFILLKVSFLHCEIRKLKFPWKG